MIVDVVIPALNEERGIAAVLSTIPTDFVRRIVVVDNGSTDGTAEVAAKLGAVVVQESERGYGAACLRGLAELGLDQHSDQHSDRQLDRQPDPQQSPPQVVVFLDADFSDDPRDMAQVLVPIQEGSADMVIGSRVLGRAERGALLPQQRVGNAVACGLIWLLYRHRYTDLGPFRAITWEALSQLAMCDRNFGWTAEMQVKAVRAGLRVVEVPVSYRPRIGRSKISGTLRGTILAGWKILTVVLRYGVALQSPRHGR